MKTFKALPVLLALHKVERKRLHFMQCLELRYGLMTFVRCQTLTGWRLDQILRSRNVALLNMRLRDVTLSYQQIYEPFFEPSWRPQNRNKRRQCVQERRSGDTEIPKDSWTTSCHIQPHPGRRQRLERPPCFRRRFFQCSDPTNTVFQNSQRVRSHRVLDMNVSSRLRLPDDSIQPSPSKQVNSAT